MKRIDVVATATHQIETAHRLMKGAHRCGWDARHVHGHHHVTADCVAVWGWRNGLIQRQRNRYVDILVMERGYLGDRFKWYSLGWNGLNGRATFPEQGDDGQRWRKHFAPLMRPVRVRRTGGPAIIMGQVPGDASILNVDINKWYTQAASALEALGYTDLRFRPHPVTVERNGGRVWPSAFGIKTIYGSLDEDLAQAGCVCAYNSNSLVDAAMAGVPILAGDEGTMAWPIAGQGLDAKPTLGDRAAWGSRLAWCQWTEEEMEDGTAWEAVAAALPRARARKAAGGLT